MAVPWRKEPELPTTDRLTQGVSTMSEPIRLLVDPGNPDGAARTFDTVEQQIGSAEKSIEIFMYVWRNDEIGNRLGQAALEAAERGIQVRILKDRGAIMFERIEMNGKSFFHTPLSRMTRWKYKFIGRTFPDTHIEDDYGTGLGERISNHPNVEIEWVSTASAVEHRCRW